MRSHFLNLCLTAGVLLGALTSAAPGHAALPHSTRRHAPAHHALVRPHTAAPSSRFQLCAIQEVHVYLTEDAAANMVDVTSTLYSLNGQVYAVLNGTTIAIVLDADSGTVYNTAGRSIGFMARVNKPADVTPCALLSGDGARAVRASLL